MKPFKLTALLTFILLSNIALAQKVEVGIDHFSILVQDLNRSCDFYQQILGLKEIEDQTQLDHIRWFSMGKKTELHIVESENYKIPNEKRVHFALRAKDLDAFVENLKKYKIYYENLQGKPHTTNERPDGIRQVYFKDPDGYWIEVNGK